MINNLLFFLFIIYLYNLYKKNLMQIIYRKLYNIQYNIVRYLNL